VFLAPFSGAKKSYRVGRLERDILSFCTFWYSNWYLLFLPVLFYIFFTTPMCTVYQNRLTLLIVTTLTVFGIRYKLHLKLPIVKCCISPCYSPSLVSTVSHQRRVYTAYRTES